MSPHRPLFMVQDRIVTWLILKCWGLTNRMGGVCRPRPPLSLGPYPWLPHCPSSPPRHPRPPHLPVLQLLSSQRRWDKRRKLLRTRRSSGCWGGRLPRYTTTSTQLPSCCLILTVPEGADLLTRSLIGTAVVLKELSWPSTSATVERRMCTEEDESCRGVSGIIEVAECSSSPRLIALSHLCMRLNPNVASCPMGRFPLG